MRGRMKPQHREAVAGADATEARVLQIGDDTEDDGQERERRAWRGPARIARPLWHSASGAARSGPNAQAEAARPGLSSHSRMRAHSTGFVKTTSAPACRARVR